MLKKNPASKTWTFETFDVTSYGRFMKVLKMFDIEPILESYVYPLDTSYIKFSATKECRLKIEYIYRHMMNLERRYLLDLDGYQNRHKLYMEECYAIY